MTDREDDQDRYIPPRRRPAKEWLAEARRTLSGDHSVEDDRKDQE